MSQLRLAGTQEVTEGRKGFWTEGERGSNRVGLLGGAGEAQQPCKNSVKGEFLSVCVCLCVCTCVCARVCESLGDH